VRRRGEFARGAARTLDMAGSGKTARATRSGRYLKRSDEAAIAQDWKVVGDDLRRAIRTTTRSALSQ
jgi:hypothetical protein